MQYFRNEKKLLRQGNSIRDYKRSLLLKEINTCLLHIQNEHI